MTLDEAIKTEENIAEENQRIVDTGVVFDDVIIDELYCDDTEVIEEHLANYQRCADEHRQIAEWLKELKNYKEQYESYLKKSGIVISQLREDRDRLLDALDKIRTEIISREEVLQIIQRIKENE